MDVQEAASKTPQELQAWVAEKASRDLDFRARLIAEPRAVLAQELGFALPSNFDVKVMEDDVTTAHLVLPPTGALDDAQLEMAAGGGAWSCACKDPNCDPNDDD